MYWEGEKGGKGREEGREGKGKEEGKGRGSFSYVIGFRGIDAPGLTGLFSRVTPS